MVEVLAADGVFASADVARPGAVILARHGEPDLSRKVRLTADDYRRWWGSYEAKGLRHGQTAPEDLKAIARKAGVVIASTRPRSMETAKAVCAGRAYCQDPLFIEAPLPPPHWPAWVKLSPRLWGFISRVWWWFFDHNEGQESRTQAQERAEWQEKRSSQMADESSRLDEQETTVTQELADFATRESQLVAELRAAQEAASAASVDDLLRQLADLRALAAESQGHLRNCQASLDALRRSSEAVKSQSDSKSSRLAGLVQEVEKLDGETHERSAMDARLAGQIAALQAEIAPAESELAQIHTRQIQTESEERRLQQLLRQDETQYNAAHLRLQRSDDRVETLRGEIRQDFGLAEMEQSEDVAYQPPLPFDTLVAQLPVVTELAPGLDEEVLETRARLRRLSNVNPDAPREYAEAAGRHDFLRHQSEDLEKAAFDLRRIIRELDKRMEVELRRTFDAVSVEFVHFFELLFRGGSAQISLTNPEDIINTGVEIVARPPGKRPQSLDLLSGGERSLTACALIFAILRVSPTPFCILDEVDAALDEANVDRFREVVEELGGHTQFILITHNRRTLEASNTIYGITMGDDGVSRVISLRLEGDEMVEIERGATAAVTEDVEVVAM